MTITVDRAMHCLSVAKRMKELAINYPQYFDVSADEAFVLGLVHDVGYEFVTDQKDHARIGGELLRKQGYKYWQEVFYHGIPQDEYDSSMLFLLNYADLVVGPFGNNMTIKDRIEDISSRYGNGSHQEIEAMKLAKKYREIECQINCNENK